MFNDCIIMAGGSGTRLWPASSSKKPKQFLSAGKDKSFLALAIERALTVIEGSGRVIIIAGISHIPPIIDVCKGFPESQQKHMVLIPEPEAKNTAPAIAAGVSYIDATSNGQDRSVLVLTSDHLISPLETFKANAEAAVDFAQQNNLVVFGIVPDSPNTGFGYIETSKLLDDKTSKVYKTAAFREKPDLKTAQEFLKAGNFYWNSGMFAFSSKFMLNEFKTKTPELFDSFAGLKAPDKNAYNSQGIIRILEKWEGLDSAYGQAQRISFDYAIAEKCSHTVMVKADFQWLDVGSWDLYAGIINTADNQDIFCIESESSFVDSDIPVALINAEDLIVVIRTNDKDSPKAALIAKKGETQKVQDIVKQIKDAGRTDLL